MKRAKAAVKLELEKKKALDFPIITYDRRTQQIYKKYNDGLKVVVGERVRKGRYSEGIGK